MKKIWSFLVSVVLILSSLLAVPMTAQAAGTVLRAGTGKDVFNSMYGNSIKVSGKTSGKIFGASNYTSAHNARFLTDEAGSGFARSDWFTADATATEAGWGIVYNDIGYIEGKMADLRVTFTNWDSNMRDWTTYNKTTAKRSGKFHAAISVRKSNVAFSVVGINWVNVKFEFVEAGTTKRISEMEGGHFTLRDVDDGQGIYFPSDSNVDEAVYLGSTGWLKPSGDNTIKAAENTYTTSAEKKGWITCLFKGNNAKIRFTTGEYYKATDGVITQFYEQGDEKVNTPYFDFTPMVLGMIEPYDEIDKKISGTSIGYEDALDYTQAKESSPYLIEGEKGTEPFTYHVATKVAPNQYDEFVISDSINKSLVIDSVKVIDRDSGSDVTKKFTITKTNNNVRAVATKDALSSASFVNNRTYILTMKVHKDPNKDLPKISGEWQLVSNMGYAKFDVTGLSPKTISTKKVWAGFKSPPEHPEKPEIEKRVGAKGVSWELAETCENEETAYKIEEYNAFDYLVGMTIKNDGADMEKFTFTDTLEECLDIDNASKVTISDAAGNIMDSQFNITVGEDKKGAKTITIKAKQEALEDEDLWNNKQYIVRMTVHRKKTTDVADCMKEWLDSDGYTFHIPNTAALQTKSVGKQEEKAETNESWVTDVIRSELQIEKTCIPYDGWEVGSEVEYAVKVTQTRQDGYAVNVTAWDYDLPDGLKLVPSSIVVTGTHTSSGSIANVEPDGLNGWKATCPRMQYGDSFSVSFRALADESVNGKDTINTAYATADNFINEDGENLEVSDSAEAWINTPKLTIDKYMDRYEHEVGDTVKYTVVVNNTKDYTVAKNVVVSDISLPLGMRLQEDGVKVSFSPDSAANSVGWPVADGTEVIAKEARDNEVEISEHNNTWTVRSKYLSSDASMSIEFTCIAEEDINGMEVQNQASVTADNAIKDGNGIPEVSWDDAKVYVNTADLTIEKTASQYEWQVDDSVNYQIVVSNQGSAQGTIARNVVIKDIEIPEGLLLEGLDQVTVNGVPVTIVDQVAGPQDIPNQLNPEYYNSTQEKDNLYELASEGTGFVLNIPNLPQGESVTIDFPCRAVKVAEGDDSWEWINTASVEADNQRGHQTQVDDAELYINTANLTLDKTMTNVYYQPENEEYDNREGYEFRVGEDVQYQLTVNNIQRNSIARNVVIKDITLPAGYSLAGEVVVEGFRDTWRNPVAGTPDTANQLDENHYKETETLDFTFQVDTVTNEDGSSGFTVTIPNLPCTTGDALNPEWNQPLVITYHCVADDSVNGDQIINTADITADNAGEKKDSEMVWINSPKLKVVKKADRDNYKIGDVITYEITATQNQIGTVARNVFFEDILLTEGVKLQKNSIVLMDENGAVINDDEYEVEIYNDHFTLKTKRPLICPDGNYPFSDLDKNGQIADGGAYNPLGITKQKKMVVEYQAVAEDESLSGKTVDNKITVNSDENIPDEDEEHAPINSPVLNIEKTSDKQKYHVGETGIYKLVITQLREDVTALNVTITDALQVKGAKIVSDSLEMEFNGKAFKPVSQEVTDTGFTVQTGKDLTDQDKIEIVYQVLFESPSLNDKKVNNIAAAWGENTPKEEQENVVEVSDLTPALTIEKSSDKAEYKIGETGHYTVIVSQTREGATARNVIIKDALQIEGAKILPDTIMIMDSLGTTLKKPEIDANALAYTIHTGENLAFGESFTVTYDVLFEDESLSGKSILNIARATADNAKAETTNDVTTPVSVGDGLTALKTCSPENGSVVKNGQEITYHITIKNTSDQEKQCVLIKDKIPALTEFVKITGMPANAVNTDKVQIDDHTSGQYLVIDQEGYAAFILKNLAAGASRTVSFVVKVTGASEDDMIVNVGQVRESVAQEEDITEDTWKSDRFNPTNDTVHFLDTQWAVDTNTVTVPEPGLAIEKTSDKTKYSVGDKGTYTLTVTQTKDGAVSRNVVIADAMETEGVEIVENSIKVADASGEIKEAKITIGEDKRSFTAETGKDLKAGEMLTVTYQVLFKEESLSGKTVYNVAIARDDTTVPGEEPSDDHKVEVGNAVLAIEKVSDKYEYKLGETAKYTLQVTNKSKDVIADHVVITDTLANKDAELDAGSIEITDADGVKVKAAEIKAEDHGFTIDTNSDLAYGEKFLVSYKVLFKNSKLVGHDVKNTAKAKADNTDKVDTTNQVTIAGDDKKEVKPSATPTPTPKVTAKPSSTTGTTQRGGTTTTSVTSSNGGTTSEGGKVTSPVKTGDETPIALYVVILAVGICAVTGIIVYKKKKAKNK